MLFIVMSARKQKNRNHEKKDVIMGDKTHTALPQGGSVHTAVALRAGGKVLPNRLYRHFGRILVSRANPQKVEMRYYYAEIDPAMSVRPKDDDWKECSEIHYNELMTRKDAVTKYEQTGAPCEHCACQIYGLPCHCAFPRGAMTGYFELLHCNKQYSNNPTI